MVTRKKRNEAAKAEVKENPKPQKDVKPETMKKGKTEVKKFTRVMAFTMAFKELNKAGFTKDQIVKRADDIYTEPGGESNPKETVWSYNYGQKFINSLKEVGLTEIIFNVHK